MFFMTHADLDGLRSASARYQANMTALRLLHDLTAQQRDPQSLTRAEQQTLARYTAFGEAAVLNRVFTESRANDPYGVPTRGGAVVPTAELAAVTNEVEQASIKRTALTAFYTPPDIVGAIWSAMLRLGLGRVECPRILEPAAGTGNFISLMPDEIRKRAVIDAVEIDPVSARIVGMLHPDVRVWQQGFQEVAFPADYFDLVISNVPFSDVGVVDQRMPKAFLTRTLHDYFFAKAVQVVRPGGIVAFLTSYGTMDKQDTRVRSWLAHQARLLGAFRLPQGVFGDVAGTESGTDLLILQRYPAAETDRDMTWITADRVDLPTMGNGSGRTTGSRIHGSGNARLSQYWADHPSHVIGRMGQMLRYGSFYLVVEPPDAGIAGTLNERLETLPRDVIPPAEEL